MTNICLPLQQRSATCLLWLKVVFTLRTHSAVAIHCGITIKHDLQSQEWTLVFPSLSFLFLDLCYVRMFLWGSGNLATSPSSSLIQSVLSFHDIFQIRVINIVLSSLQILWKYKDNLTSNFGRSIKKLFSKLTENLKCNASHTLYLEELKFRGFFSTYIQYIPFLIYVFFHAFIPVVFINITEPSTLYPLTTYRVYLGSLNEFCNSFF